MITTQQAAKILKITRGRVHQLILCGSLPATKFGRDYQLDEADVEAAKNRPSPGRPRKTPNPSSEAKTKIQVHAIPKILIPQ